MTDLSPRLLGVGRQTRYVHTTPLHADSKHTKQNSYGWRQASNNNVEYEIFSIFRHPWMLNTLVNAFGSQARGVFSFRKSMNGCWVSGKILVLSLRFLLNLLRAPSFPSLFLSFLGFSSFCGGFWAPYQFGFHWAWIQYFPMILRVFYYCFNIISRLFEEFPYFFLQGFSRVSAPYQFGFHWAWIQYVIRILLVCYQCSNRISRNFMFF